MTALKRLSLAVSAFVMVQLIFFAGLMGALAIPDAPIVENLAAAVDAGTYGPSYAPDRMGSMSDTFTECVVAGTGLGASNDETLFSKSVRMPRLSNCEEGSTQIMELDMGGQASSGDYFKYWAGYTVLTRPALATVGLEGLRIVAGALMVASMVSAFVAFRRRVGLAVPLIIAFTWLVGTNVLSTPSTSFSQSISIAAMFFSMQLGIWGASRSASYATVGAALGAALFCYVDLLTAPAIPWVLTAFAAGTVTWSRTQTLRATLTTTVSVSVVWPLTFAATWISRWVIAAIILGPDVTWRAVRANIERRTRGAYEGVSDVPGAGVVTNVGYWIIHVPTWWLVLVGCMLTIVFGLIRVAKVNGSTGFKLVGILCLPVFAIPLWYLALSNHSQLHEFFTSRGVPLVLGIAAAASLAAAQPVEHFGWSRQQAKSHGCEGTDDAFASSREDVRLHNSTFGKPAV